jgi:hypothetical protein
MDAVAEEEQALCAKTKIECRLKTFTRRAGPDRLPIWVGLLDQMPSSVTVLVVP